ncbi:MAG: helix-turn-helix transcriptional regulator [Rhodospirillaceae bacterium]|nr:helix-turn-helix transcriptional regulator [Rhodospirillaceae bacterium]
MFEIGLVFHGHHANIRHVLNSGLDMTTELSLARLLGRAIREARLEQGLRQVELSTISGVAAPTISDIENAARDTRLSSVQRLMDALRLKPETILSGKELEEDQGKPSGDAEGYDLGSLS